MEHKFKPLTRETWADFERLFGPRGACGGCWCIYPLVSRKEFNAGKGDGNRAAMRKRVQNGAVPGLIAYVDGEPAGWIALGPRDQYVRLNASRILKPVDDRPVWSIVCLFIDKKFRRQGLSSDLIEAAAGYARKQGAEILEGYPHDLKGGKLPDAFVWTGLEPAYRKAGFREVARRSEKRPILRLDLKPAQNTSEYQSG